MFGSNCRRVRRLFSTRLDERLEQGQRRFVDDHLACCEGCSTRFADLRYALDRARSVEILEPDSEFEETIVAAVALEAAQKRTERDGSTTLRSFRDETSRLSGRRWVPVCGIGLVSAAALLFGFLLRDFFPGMRDDVRDDNRASSMNGFGAEIAKDLASVRGSVLDHMSDSRDVFLHLASLEGKRPEEEVQSAWSELDYSKLEPKTIALQRMVNAVDLGQKNEVLNYLDSTVRLVSDLRGTAKADLPSVEMVVVLRHTVLDSGILQRIDGLRRIFVEDHNLHGVGVDRPMHIAEADMEDRKLFERGRALFFAKDNTGAMSCFAEHRRRFPSSPFRVAADYSYTKAALRAGDLDTAWHQIHVNSTRLLRGESKFNVVTKEFLRLSGGLESFALEFPSEVRLTEAGKNGNVFISGSGGRLFQFEMQGNHLAVGSVVVTIQGDSEEEEEDRVVSVIVNDPGRIENLERFADYYPELLEIRLETLDGTDEKGRSVRFCFDPSVFCFDPSVFCDDPKLQQMLKSCGLNQIQIRQSASSRRK